MPASRLTSALVSIGAAITLTACSSGITADTSCEEFLQQPGSARADAVTRIGAELKDRDAGSPLLPPAIDYSCGQQPNRTIGDVFERRSNQ